MLTKHNVCLFIKDEEHLEEIALNIERKFWHIYRINDTKLAIRLSVFHIDGIIKETLDEYTNDENHDRVLFWNGVKDIFKQKYKRMYGEDYPYEDNW